MNITIFDLLKKMISLNASDLHLIPNHYPSVRINGELQYLEEYGLLSSHVIQDYLASIMNDAQQTEVRNHFEIDFAYHLVDVARFRVNVFYQANGIGAVFRAIPERIPNLSELKLPIIQQKLDELKNGLILVTGPTGSGKSTTLAAMIHYLNQKHAYHILTIEDPIEYIHHSERSLINQRQVRRDTKGFNKALRAALREDPDIILIGELRDLNTIRLALTAAETGHLVLATLHTSSAPRTIHRIIDVFPAEEKNMVRNMLAESIEVILCQQLIKKKGGGRIAAFEIMLGTSAIRHLIREDKIMQMANVMQTGSSVGMCTMEQYVEKLQANQLIHV